MKQAPDKLQAIARKVREVLYVFTGPGGHQYHRVVLVPVRPRPVQGTLFAALLVLVLFPAGCFGQADAEGPPLQSDAIFTVIRDQVGLLEKQVHDLQATVQSLEREVRAKDTTIRVMAEKIGELEPKESKEDRPEGAPDPERGGDGAT